MTLLALAALSIAQTTGQEPASGRVTVSTGLLPASQTLAAISKATGLDLRTTPSTADYPLMVRVTDAEPNAVLGHVAKILGAEWKQDGSAYVLTSDSALRRSLSRAADVRRAERLSKEIARLDATTRDIKYDAAFAEAARKESKKLMETMMKSLTEGNQPPNPMSIFSSTTFGQSPSSRAIHSLLALIGGTRLASLTPGERVVFALRPTRMQAALPAGSQWVVESFLQSAAQYAQAAKSLGEDEASEFPLMFGDGRQAEAKGPPADAHLELWIAEEMINANLTVYDANDLSLGRGFSFIGLPSAVASAPAGEPLTVSSLGREWGAKLRAASEGTAALRGNPMGMAMMFGAGGAATNAQALASPLSPALKSLLSDPVQNSLGAPLFEPVAAAFSGDLIATVPDSGLTTLGGLIADPRTTAAGARTTIENSPEFSVLKDGTLTLIGASTPARLHREFADRRALRELFAAATRSGYLRLDDAARYALAQKSQAGALNLASPMITLVQGKSPVFFMADPFVAEFETLRIYGSLTKAQRASLTSGKGVPFTSLSAEATDALERLLFDSPTGPYPTLDPEDESAEGNPEELSSLFSAMNSRGAERTVRFADGVPRQGFLTISSQAQDLYRMLDSSTGATAFGDAGLLGFLRGAKEMPFFKNFAAGTNYDRFTPAKGHSFELTFSFAPRLALSRSLQDYELASTQTLTYDSLPKEFREEVETMAKMATEMKAPPGKIRP